jgi:hypothetical protein
LSSHLESLENLHDKHTGSIIDGYCLVLSLSVEVIVCHTIFDVLVKLPSAFVRQNVQAWRLVRHKRPENAMCLGGADPL